MIEESKYRSLEIVKSNESKWTLGYWVIGIFAFLILFIILAPWTQNVEGKGKVTTLRPEQQPHTINSFIAGRVEKWYVIEGQHVRVGDTLARLSEVKADYLDPNLSQNLDNQLAFKKSSLEAYLLKLDALTQTVNAIKQEFSLKQSMLVNKVQQKRNKLAGDSVTYQVKKINFKIEERRLSRADSLFSMGIKSRKDLEESQMKFQKSVDDLAYYENNLEVSRNELMNAIIDSRNYLNEYNGKLNKLLSDRLSTMSDMNLSNKELSELENKISNFDMRKANYYVRASQESYVFKTYKQGLGEIVKEGEPLVSLIPAHHDLAVEIFVKPIDIPLIKIGERNRIIFDGWPSLVFSGWPNTSFGSFGGEVYAIDRNISQNGLYRVLVIPDGNEDEWPEQLKLGSAAKGIFLLNDVKVWFELWRNINGFPPEYYNGEKSKYPIDETIDEKYHTK